MRVLGSPFKLTLKSHRGSSGPSPSDPHRKILPQNNIFSSVAPLWTPVDPFREENLNHSWTPQGCTCLSTYCTYRPKKGRIRSVINTAEWESNLGTQKGWCTVEVPRLALIEEVFLLPCQILMSFGSFFVVGPERARKSKRHFGPGKPLQARGGPKTTSKGKQELKRRRKTSLT